MVDNGETASDSRVTFDSAQVKSGASYGLDRSEYAG